MQGGTVGAVNKGDDPWGERGRGAFRHAIVVEVVGFDDGRIVFLNEARNDPVLVGIGGEKARGEEHLAAGERTICKVIKAGSGMEWQAWIDAEERRRLSAFGKPSRCRDLPCEYAPSSLSFLRCNT